MGDGSRHHFVPQFYLRLFALPGGRRIRLFHLPTNSFVPSASIRCQAQRARLYGPAFYERAFGDLEKGGAPVLRDIITLNRAPQRPSQEDAALLIYLLFQAFRTPAAGRERVFAYEQMANAVRTLHPDFAHTIPHDTRTVNECIHESLQDALLGHLEIFDLLCKVIVNDTNIPFVTSDDPVVLYNQLFEDRRLGPGGIGLAVRGLQILFPISPRHYLIAYDSWAYRFGPRGMRAPNAPATPADVHQLNLLQAIHAESHLYCNEAISEGYLNTLIAEASAKRLSSRTSTQTLQQSDNPNRHLVVFSRTTLAAQLRLSMLSLLPAAKRFRWSGLPTELLRDPEFTRIHQEFLEAVRRGEVDAMGFAEFQHSRRSGPKSRARSSRHTTEFKASTPKRH